MAAVEAMDLEVRVGNQLLVPGYLGPDQSINTICSTRVNTAGTLSPFNVTCTGGAALTGRYVSIQRLNAATGANKFLTLCGVQVGTIYTYICNVCFDLHTL